MSDPSGQFDHRSHPPATAMGPDTDDDEPTAVTDDDEAGDDTVEQFIAPGESPEDAEPPTRD